MAKLAIYRAIVLMTVHAIQPLATVREAALKDISGKTVKVYANAKMEFVGKWMVLAIVRANITVSDVNRSACVRVGFVILKMVSAIATEDFMVGVVTKREKVTWGLVQVSA